MENVEKEQLTKALEETNFVRIPFESIEPIHGINRTVCLKHAEKCKNEIKDANEFYGAFLVAKHPKTEGRFVLVDYGHRFEALKSVGRNVAPMCQIINAKTEAEIAEAMKRINSNGKKWTILNHVNALAGLGNKHYQILNNLFVNNKLTAATLPMLLSLQSRPITKKQIEKGTFRVVNPNWERNLSEVEEIIEMDFTAKGSNRRPYIEALVQLVSNADYNHSVFVENLGSVGKKAFQIRIMDKESNDILKVLHKIQRKTLSIAA
jgi:hypothetical protein